jgi:polyisoprenoid-binding protein YceI
MNLFKSFLAVVAVFAISMSAVFAQSYTIDTKSSVLIWKGEKLTKVHTGTVQIKNGTIAKNKTNFTGDFVIDMTTIKIDDVSDQGMNDKFLGHLRADDFFSVDKFNTAALKIKKSEAYTPKADENANYMLTADLTIKGITNEIKFPAKMNFNGKDLAATAHIVIDRTKWNVRYGSGSFFDNLGDTAIYDNITFDLTLKGKSN